MYLRTTSRQRADGSRVRYLQLAHNQWDPERKRATAKVVYSFGREDELDRGAIERLVRSLSRVLDPSVRLDVAAEGSPFEYQGSRSYGGAWVLDQLWRRLGIDRLMRRMLEGTRRSVQVERVLFAMVANRALDPSSKLAATRWVGSRVAIDGLEGMSDDECYRAMDWLLSVEQDLAREVYWSTSDLLNLEVDLLFYDTTSTYFEVEQADTERAERAAREGRDVPTQELRERGKSKDHRPDLPQVVIGMAVTRTGIPVRVWVFPGQTNDQELIRRAKDDLKEWRLSRVVWVGDRGFSSEQNRRYLQRCGGHYILGEKLRGNTLAARALGAAGRYRHVAGNLKVKEVNLDEAPDRFVICFNPDEARRDEAVRERILVELALRIGGSDTLEPDARTALHAGLGAGMRRFVRVTARGLLRIDQTAVKREQKLDGKYLLRSSDPALSAEDIALGYKQLLEVERGWRDMKSDLLLRPVFHRLEDRIRAHVLLCWLALLLIRIAETTVGQEQTWRRMLEDLEQIHLGTFTGPTGTIERRTATTLAQRAILGALDLPEPPQLTTITAEPATTPDPHPALI